MTPLRHFSQWAPPHEEMCPEPSSDEVLWCRERYSSHAISTSTKLKLVHLPPPVRWMDSGTNHRTNAVRRTRIPARDLRTRTHPRILNAVFALHFMNVKYGNPYDNYGLGYINTARVGRQLLLRRDRNGEGQTRRGHQKRLKPGRAFLGLFTHGTTASQVLRVQRQQPFKCSRPRVLAQLVASGTAHMVLMPPAESLTPRVCCWFAGSASCRGQQQRDKNASITARARQRPSWPAPAEPHRPTELNPRG